MVNLPCGHAIHARFVGTSRQEEKEAHLDVEWAGVGPNTLGEKTWHLQADPGLRTGAKRMLGRLSEACNEVGTMYSKQGVGGWPQQSKRASRPTLTYPSM